MSKYSVQLWELRTKNMSLEEKLQYIKDHHLTEGCNGEYHGIRDILCDYKHSCKYMMEYDSKQYCMKNGFGKDYKR